MRHYDVSQWADFARNLLPADKRLELEQHLATGCAECASIYEFLRHVSEKATAEIFYDAITSKLAPAARRIFREETVVTERASGLWDNLRALIGKLSYDSSLDLHPVGARSSRAANRQMMYLAGDFCLDLRFDRERDSLTIVLVGQVADQSNPASKMGELPVLLIAGKKVVKETSSNDFGEFTIEYTPRRNLRLCVPVRRAGVRLEVPLSHLLEEHES